MKTKHFKAHLRGIKIKASPKDDIVGELSGFATTFEDPKNYDAYGEIVARGAVKLEQVEGLPMLYSHDQGEVVGLWTRAEVAEDRRGVEGLLVHGDIIDTAKGRDLAVQVRTGALKGLSIGYVLNAHEELKAEGHMTRFGFPVWRLTDIDLKEISPTAMPANDRALIQQIRDERGAQAKRDEKGRQYDEDASRSPILVLFADWAAELNLDSKTAFSMIESAIMGDEEGHDARADPGGMADIMDLISSIRASLKR